jgi:hypothetical protein
MLFVVVIFSKNQNTKLGFEYKKNEKLEAMCLFPSLNNIDSFGALL